MDTAAEETQDGRQKRCGTTDIAVFGTIDHNGRRRIAARMVEVDTCAREHRLWRAGGTGGRYGAGAQEDREGDVREREGRGGIGRGG